MYSAWALSDSSKTKIANIFGQAHPDLIGHHVTYMFGNDSVAPEEAKIALVGHCVTDSIECFVVEVNGSIKRQDGAIYHLTWSLDKSKGAKPVDSNKAIEANGFKHLPHSIEISTTPKLFKF